MTGFEHAFDQIAKPLIAGEAKAGDAPTSDVAKTDGPASRNNSRQGRTAGIRGAEDAANACSSNVRNRDLVFLEDSQNAKMGEAARKSTSEGQTNPRVR